MNQEVLRERKESNLFEWRRYLQILDMLKDDRSQPYIAKKLGFKNASSIANILNRFQGLETLISEHTAVVEKSAVEELTKSWLDYVAEYEDTHPTDLKWFARGHLKGKEFKALNSKGKD